MGKIKDALATIAFLVLLALFGKYLRDDVKRFYD